MNELKKRIKIIVAYDGSNYCGWQIQPNGVTIEEVLNKTISELCGAEIKVIGASRTDSGVHARGNVAVFDTCAPIPPKRFLYAINRLLPPDIVVMQSEEVEASWHPRFQKSRKTYRYHLDVGVAPNPIKRTTHYYVAQTLDLKAMDKAATFLVGKHDFAGFTKEECQEKNTVREIYQAEFLYTVAGEDFSADALISSYDEIIFTIQGNGFLYNMVRMILGLLLEIGKGKYPPEIVGDVLQNPAKIPAKVTAKAHGLILWEIAYENVLTSKHF